MTTRRDAVKKLTGLTVAGWVTPVIQSISLPSHAQASPGSAFIVEIILDTSTLPIGGPSVPYSAVLSNTGASTLSVVLLQAFVQQPGVSRAGGFTQVLCGGASGDLPPGICNTGFTVIASNTTAGTGTLAPGPATAVFELQLNSAVIDTLSIPVTLV